MQLHISESNQIIENKTFTAAHYAKEDMPDGTKRGTFRTYTVLVDGDNIHFKNCVFENSAGKGKDVGQAIALYIDGDDITLEDCTLIGHQDTVFLAPLPEKEIIPGGFIGPKQFTERKRRTVHFKNCTIKGGVDFIFGGATAYFDNCELVSVEEGVGKATCFVARPWRNHAYVRLENCYLGEHIHPSAFDDWGKTEAHATVRFSESGSYGPSANHERPHYLKQG